MTDRIKEIIEAITGKTPDENVKTAINMTITRVNDITEKSVDIGTISLLEPVVEIKNRQDFTQIDLIFKSDASPDLRSFWNLLEMYGDQVNKDPDNLEHDTVLSTIVFVPMSLDGGAYMLAVNPLFWVIQPERPGFPINTIRILCKDENVVFMENSNADIEKIKQEADIELRNEVANIERMERSYGEREEYQNELNKKVEELRRNRQY